MDHSIDRLCFAAGIGATGASVAIVLIEMDFCDCALRGLWSLVWYHPFKAWLEVSDLTCDVVLLCEQGIG